MTRLSITFPIHFPVLFHPVFRGTLGQIPCFAPQKSVTSSHQPRLQAYEKIITKELEWVQLPASSSSDICLKRYSLSKLPMDYRHIPGKQAVLRHTWAYRAMQIRLRQTFSTVTSICSEVLFTPNLFWQSSHSTTYVVPPYNLWDLTKCGVLTYVYVS